MQKNLSLPSFTRRRLLPLATGVGFLVASKLSSEAITIQIDYTYDMGVGSFFSAGSAERDRLEDAATFYSNLLTDDLDAIEPTGNFGTFTPESWQVTFTNPDTGASESINDLVIPEDTIIVYVGARSLGSGELANAGPGGYNSFAFPGSTFDTAVETRGESGVGTTDFAPWGGQLTVDDATTWDTSLNGGGGGQHLYSTLLHEFGHILGIGTSDSWRAQVSGSEFTGSASIAEHGSNVPLFFTAGNGFDHWAQGTSSTILNTNTSQETSYDPDVTGGQIKFVTDLDVAGLADVGWDIAAPVPEPSTGLLLALCGSIALLRRQRS